MFSYNPQEISNTVFEYRSRGITDEMRPGFLTTGAARMRALAAGCRRLPRGVHGLGFTVGLQGAESLNTEV